MFAPLESDSYVDKAASNHAKHRVSFQFARRFGGPLAGRLRSLAGRGRRSAAQVCP